MAATSAERVVYAAKSRKWNSTQNNKFPAEFPTEHAANLEWIRKTEEEASARRRVDEELLAQENSRLRRTGQRTAKKRSDGRGKWIILGVISVFVAMRAWQRYNEVATV